MTRPHEQHIYEFDYSGSSPNGRSCKLTTLKNPVFSTPLKTLYFCIPVSGQLTGIFRFPRVSAYESCQCN